MTWWGKFIAPFTCGIAFNKFAGKKYKDAVKLLNRIIEIDPDGDRMEIIYSCLGRSYMALGEYDKALDEMEKAYSLFKNQDGKKDEAYLKENKEFLKAYSWLLYKKENNKLAKIIADKLLELEVR